MARSLWIESHADQVDHPKTLNLMLAMEWDLDQTLGKLDRFRFWVAKNAPDGDLRRFSNALLATVVGLPPADGKKFVDAMVDAGGQEGGEPLPGFLEKEPYFRVHDWWKYFGRFLQGSLPKPEWQKVQTAYGYAREEVPSKSRVGLDKPAEPAAPPPSPSTPPSSPSRLTETRDTTTNGNGSCGTPSAPPPEPVVMVFPVVGLKTAPRQWALTESKCAQYLDAYPGVDVLGQCKAARQWCIDNPKNQKTAAGMPAFLSRWLTKEQNRFRGNGAAPRPQASPEVTKLIRAFQIAKGCKDDKGWNSLMFDKSVKPATDLLAYFEGDLDAACSCIENVSSKFVDTQFDWNWNAVLTRAPGFKKGEEWIST